MRNIRMGVLLTLLAAFSVFSIQGVGQDLIPVVFQSKWFPQAQFAGNFVAGGHLPDSVASSNVPTDDNGLSFYAQEGLDVTILDGGGANPSVSVATGNADFGTDWIANMLLQRQSGLDLTHIAQIFQVPAYLFVALKDSGIESVDDFAGRTVGVWAFGNEFVAGACFAAHGFTSTLDTTISDPDITTLTYQFDPAIVFPNEVDVASAMIYNELDQIIGLGFPLDELSVISAANSGCGLLEDFLFTTNALLESDNFKGSGLSGLEVAERFVRATLRGWEYAANNQAEAVEVVLEFCGNTCNGSGSTSSPEIHQAWQMARVAEMVQPGLLTDQGILDLYGFATTPDSATIGCLNTDDYNNTVALLENIGLIEEGGSNREDVVTSAVLDAAGIVCN